MGIGIVLGFWGTIGIFLAVLARLVLRGVTAHHTRNLERGPRAATLAGRLPIGCLLWAGAVFLSYAIINDRYFQRDPGIGDGWYCPVPGGYAIEMLDRTDYGLLSKSGHSTQANSPSGVRTLQIATPYILGGIDEAILTDPSSNHEQIDSYFLIDTRNGKLQRWATEEELRQETQKYGIELRLQPIGAVYFRYRYTWFDALAAILVFSPPIAGIVLLIVWVRYLHKKEARKRFADASAPH